MHAQLHPEPSCTLCQGMFCACSVLLLLPQVMGLEIPMRDLRLMDPALAAWESFAQILVSSVMRGSSTADAWRNSSSSVSCIKVSAYLARHGSYIHIRCC